jgi:carbonyl reductase 1
MGSAIAVVTGGNRGIGLEVGRQLGKKGYRVILTGRDGDAAERAASTLEDEGADVTAEELDVADKASIEAFVKARSRERAPIDVLVNNAGVSLHGFDARVARDTLEVNVFGAVRLTDRLLPSMAEEGRIIMVSSGMGELSCLSGQLRDRIASERLMRGELMSLMDAFVRDVERGDYAKKGWPDNAYSVSKVGLNAFARVLARELDAAGSSVIVTAVCPGWVRTRMGGSGAPRSVEEGADGIVWAADEKDPSLHGKFVRDRHIVPW